MAAAGFAAIIWPMLATAAEQDRPLPPDRQAKILERMPGADANHDGVLTQSEVRAAMGGARGKGPGLGMPPFMMPMDPAEILRTAPQADANSDGRLSPEEHRAFMETRRAAMEKEFLERHPEVDANGDGRLSPEEMRAARETLEQFTMSKVLAEHPEADTDGDGKLSREEFTALRQRRMGGQSPAMHVEWLIRNFQRLDADGNGQLTLEELQNFKTQAEPLKARGQDRRRGDVSDTAERRPRQAKRNRADRQKQPSGRNTEPPQ